MVLILLLLQRVQEFTIKPQFRNKLEVDTFFQDMTLIPFPNYFSIPGAPPVKCQLKESKKIQLKPHPISALHITIII